MQKIVNFVFLSVFALVLFSCSTDNVGNVNSYDDEDLITDEIFFENDSKYTTHSDEPAIPLYSAKMTYNQNLNKVVALEVNKEFLGFLEMSDDEFLEVFFEELENTVYGNGSNQSLTLSECLALCHQNFTDENGDRIKGRGHCKLGCWWEEVKEVVIEIVKRKLDKTRKKDFPLTK